MAVTRLVVTNFRNITHSEVNPANSLNFISGDNGSGKTSVLEALSTIGLGRSFRSRKFKNIIQYTHTQLSLFCEFTCQQVNHRVGVTRSVDGHSVFKLDGRILSSSVELANVLPMQVINSNSFNLLSGSSSDRRQFFDWLVFHVEHSFQTHWRDYMRCLKQRNSVLRSGRIDKATLSAWTKELVFYGDLVDKARLDLTGQFIIIFERFCKSFNFIKDGRFRIEYKKGWSEDFGTLHDYLEHNITRDIKLGYTSGGPHKSDIRITFNGKPVTELFSRGQLKSLVSAMYMAQIELYKQKNTNSCILLIDDLPAELDHDNLRCVAEWIDTFDNLQVFLTGVDLSSLMSLWPNRHKTEGKLFHVKHGEVIEQFMQSE